VSEEKKPYIILEAETVNGMQNAVRVLLSEGYVPLGGVQVFVYKPPGTLSELPFRFYQTMVFNEV
jgi:hypothetical protein